MKHFGVHPGPVSVGYSTGYGPWPREGRYVPIEKSNCVTLSVRNPEWSMFGAGLDGGPAILGACCGGGTMATGDWTKCVSAPGSSSHLILAPCLLQELCPKQPLNNRNPPSLYPSVAFNSPGPKLQAVHDDPRLAPGHPELHEDSTVSFQPGAEHPRQGMGTVIAGLVESHPWERACSTHDSRVYHTETRMMRGCPSNRAVRLVHCGPVTSLFPFPVLSFSFFSTSWLSLFPSFPT